MRYGLSKLLSYVEHRLNDLFLGNELWNKKERKKERKNKN